MNSPAFGALNPDRLNDLRDGLIYGQNQPIPSTRPDRERLSACDRVSAATYGKQLDPSTNPPTGVVELCGVRMGRWYGQLLPYRPVLKGAVDSGAVEFKIVKPQSAVLGINRKPVCVKGSLMQRWRET